MKYSDIDRFAELWAFYNTSPNGIMILDEDSNIIIVNRAMEPLTGYATKELHEMNVRDLIPRGVNNPHDEKLSTVIQNGGGPRDIKSLSDVPLLRRNGEVVSIDVERRVYKYQDGTRRFAGIITPARRTLAPKEMQAKNDGHQKRSS